MASRITCDQDVITCDVIVLYYFSDMTLRYVTFFSSLLVSRVLHSLSLSHCHFPWHFVPQELINESLSTSKCVPKRS